MYIIARVEYHILFSFQILKNAILAALIVLLILNAQTKRGAMNVNAKQDIRCTLVFALVSPNYIYV